MEEMNNNLSSVTNTNLSTNTNTTKVSQNGDVTMTNKTTNFSSETKKNINTFEILPKETQDYSVYKYTTSLYNQFQEDNNKNNLQEKLMVLLEILMALELMKEIVELLTGEDMNEKSDEDTKDFMKELLSTMSNNGQSFSYMKMNSEVEMSADEFIQIMDHMNNSDLYSGLSEEEKQYRIMETAQNIGMSSLIERNA